MRVLAVAVAVGSMVLGTAGPAAAATPASGTNPAPAVVPALREWTGGTGALALTPKSRIVVGSASLADEADQLRSDIAALTGFDLRVAKGTQAANGDILLSGRRAQIDPEGYVLDIGDHVDLRGGSDAGVFYGTQTVLQILRTTPGHRSLARGQAHDWPQFRERGHLLDIGRKYWTPDYILQTIRQLGYLHLNTLQLHFSDNNAFRLVSDKYPYLAAPQAYTKADIRRFEAAASRYHVNIIPEIEMPSHAAAAIKARPELGFSCASMAGSTLDVTKPEARQFARDLINEFAPLFSGPEFHIATDEYPTGDSQSKCPELVQYAQQHGFGSPSDVFVDFINDMNRTVRAHGKKMVIWNWWDVDQSPTISPDKNIKVEAWTTSAESGGDHSPQKYLDMGYEVVVSPSDTLYVTQGFPLLPNPQYLYEEWQPLEHPRLAGYQISVWSDNAIDRAESSFDAYLRRPEEVLADRTWGGPRQGKVTDFYARADAIGTPPGVPEYALPGKLSGTPYGTNPYETTSTYDKAYDGDPITYFLNADPDGGYTGIDLGAGKESAVSLVRYFATPGDQNLDRMVGGRFEGCTTGPTSGCKTLATVSTRPDYGWNEQAISDTGTYRWLRYVGPDGGYSSVAEIDYVAPSANVVVHAPSSLQQLGDNEVRVDYRNTTGRPVYDVRLDLNASANQDRAARALRSVGPAQFSVVQPGQTVSSRWRVDLPLSAATGVYHLAGHAAYQAQLGSDQPILEAGGFARSTLGQAVETKLDPALVALDAGDSAQTQLQFTNHAARPVTVAWHEVRTPSSGSDYTVKPSSGSLVVPAGDSRSATLTASAAANASDITRPLRLDLSATADGGPQTQLGSLDLRIRSRSHPYLSDLDWTEATSEWSTVTRDTYIGSSDPMTLNGVRYAKGLGTAGNSRISYDVSGKCTRFTATIGIDDAADFTTDGGTSHFFVQVDGKQVYESGLITRETVKSIDLDITGVHTLSLVTDNAGDGFDHDANDWADARIQCTP